MARVGGGFMSWFQRFAPWLGKGLYGRLANVAPVPVGRANDGLVVVHSGGTELDKRWDALLQEFTDALEAWRTNPLARRIIGLVTAYVVGQGIELRSHYAPLSRFLEKWWHHPQNAMALRQYGLCDELARSGELFLVLHTNPADGMSYVRSLPASSIDRIEWRPGDYEAELRYHERVTMDDPDYPEGRWWFSPIGAGEPVAGERPAPVVLHFAVNRPVGCLRGESDLAPILPWLRRYRMWLEDRVRLNAAVRAFLWIVRVPADRIVAKRAEWAQAPEAGQVIVVDRESEQWDAVAPDLKANDASADGRAIRWMIVAGGPGLGLVDMGEAESSNLATAAAMGEQRWRFMRQRQNYFAYVLGQTALVAYNRAVKLGRVQGRVRELDAIEVGLPDMATSDNANLGQGAASVAGALESLQRLGLQGEGFRRLAARVVLGFAGETLPDRDLEALVRDSVNPADVDPAEPVEEGGGEPGKQRPEGNPPSDNFRGRNLSDGRKAGGRRSEEFGVRVDRGSGGRVAGVGAAGARGSGAARHVAAERQQVRT